MEDVQAVNRSDDHSAIHNVEVQFVPDDPTIPAVGKLDSSVHRSGLPKDQSYREGTGLSLADAPDVYHKRTECGSHQHQLRSTAQRIATRYGSVFAALEGFVVQEPIDKLNRQSHIERDGDQLEDDTAQHDPSTFLGVLMIPGRNCCEGSTETLDTQSHEISRDEHDGICDRI